MSENCEQERIGNIDIGLDLEKINNILNIGKLTEDECKKCWAFQYCNMCCNKAEKITFCVGKQGLVIAN